MNPLIHSNISNYMGPNNIIQSGQVMIANRGLQHMNCILPQSINKGALFLGDVICLLKQQLLQKHQIKTILTCMVEPISKGQLNFIVNHKILPIRDIIDFPIRDYFKKARQYIDDARNQGHNVLVHCHAGVSRSAAIVCSYLMLQNNWNHEEALNFVRQKRYRAKPNISFLKQLNQFYQQEIKKGFVENKLRNQIPNNIPNNILPNNILPNNILPNNILPNNIKIINQQKHIPRISQNIIIQKNITETKQNQNITIVLQPEIQSHQDLLKTKQNLLKKPIRRKIFQNHKSHQKTSQYKLQRTSPNQDKLNIEHQKILIPKILSYDDLQNRSAFKNNTSISLTNQSDVNMNKSQLNPTIMKSAYHPNTSQTIPRNQSIGYFDMSPKAVNLSSIKTNNSSIFYNSSQNNHSFVSKEPVTVMNNFQKIVSPHKSVYYGAANSRK